MTSILFTNKSDITDICSLCLKDLSNLCAKYIKQRYYALIISRINKFEPIC